MERFACEAFVCVCVCGFASHRINLTSVFCAFARRSPSAGYILAASRCIFIGNATLVSFAGHGPDQRDGR